ncbi:MAG TPA: DUF1592 domain-containing protein [Bdellovibrionales bacterium]|nr:DUF1592 domain-containing protein [Bdellovibrionales bacterium]
MRTQHMKPNEKHISRTQIAARLALGAFAALTVTACTSKSVLQFDAPSGEEQIFAAPPAPGAVQLRVLSSREYKNSVKAILGVDVKPDLEFGARRNGFETSADGLLDQNLLSALIEEAPVVAENYIVTNLANEYPCLRDVPPGDQCVRDSVAAVGFKFFRRPLTEEEINDYHNYYNERRAIDDQHLATVQLFSRFLLSANFLYRSELGKLAAGESTTRLTQFEIASLIAFTLTATTPDTLLMNDAKSGKLSGDTIRGHVRRLLKTADGRNAVIRFMKGWLKLDNLDDMHRNPDRYAKLQSADQAWALKREFELFVKDVVLEGAGTLRAALTEPVTYVNRHTAQLYGVQNDGDSMTRVQLDGTRRGGIVTLASVMAAHASSTDVNRDRPVQRGTMILKQIMCGEVGIPSGLDVISAGNQAASRVPNYQDLTTREQFDVIMQQSESCVSCHQGFMPFGYVLGNFNALGAFVTDFRGRPINAAVTNVPMSRGRRNFDGPVAFVKELAEDERVHRCFTKQFAKFVTGADNGPYVDDLGRYFHAGFRRKKFNIRDLIEDFFSEEFLYQRKATAP